jgi:hypothetical protein
MRNTVMLLCLVVIEDYRLTCKSRQALGNEFHVPLLLYVRSWISRLSVQAVIGYTPRPYRGLNLSVYYSMSFELA